MLSPRLAQLAQPAVARESGREQAAVVGLPPSGAGSLLRPTPDRVLVYTRVRDTSAATLDGLRASGAVTVDVATDYDVVTLAVRPSDLVALAGARGVTAVDEALAPRVRPAAQPVAVPPRSGSARGHNCGAATSEGDALLQAASARQAFGVDGTGVTVGVLSDSFNTASGAPTDAQQDVRTGDLPGAGNPCGRRAPVVDVQDYHGTDATDEGRAMLQIVHDLAPGARLAFATADLGEYAFAKNIKRLHDVAGATVIVDDVTYTEDPFWQRGPIGQAVAAVTAEGVTYVSSAGNENVVVGDHNVGAYEAPAFRGGPCPPSMPPAARCHNFSTDPGQPADPTNGYTVAPGGVMDTFLQWAEPRFGVTDNFDFLLLDHTTGRVLAKSTANGVRNGLPTQDLYWQNNGTKDRQVDLVIRRDRGKGNPRLRYTFFNSGPWTAVERPVGTGNDEVGQQEIVGHNGDPLVLTTAATPWFSDSAPEDFSARGPVTWLFAPVAGKTPSARLASPEVFAKPDITATDGVSTTFFEGSAPYRFYGTSAAAPHIAAEVALLRQYRPAATPAQLRDAVRAGASPLPYGDADDSGAGLADAYAAGNLLGGN